MREGKETVFQLRRGRCFRATYFIESCRDFSSGVIIVFSPLFFAFSFSSFDSLINCFLMANLLPKLLFLIPYQTIFQPDK